MIATLKNQEVGGGPGEVISSSNERECQSHRSERSSVPSPQLVQRNPGIRGWHSPVPRYQLPRITWSGDPGAQGTERESYRLDPHDLAPRPAPVGLTDPTMRRGAGPGGGALQGVV